MNNPQISERFWKMATTAVVLVIIFLGVMSVKEIKSISYVGANPNITDSITVEGSGDAVAKPDIATFSFTVSETAPQVADAQAKATTKADNALKAVRAGGVAEEDIQTTSYSINPHYEYQDGVCSPGNICRPGKSVLTGYEVSQSVQVKVRDLTKAGALFASIGSLDVQNVNGLSFSIDKPDSIKATARAKAIASAEDKAHELARQLGVTLVRITSFSESGQFPWQYTAMGSESASMKAAAPGATEIPAGQQKVTADVTITYEIK